MPWDIDAGPAAGDGDVGDAVAEGGNGLGTSDKAHEGPWFHGTRLEYDVGQFIAPAPNPVEGHPSSGVALSPDLDGAIWEAELSQGRGTARVYRVEVAGVVERREEFPPHPSMTWRTRDRVRVVEEVVHWPLYHGTKADLDVGALIAPGHDANFGDGGRVAGHVYMTRTLDAAKWGAELAIGDGPGRIYVVEPLGPIEDDPNLTDKKFRGNPTKSFRSRDPLRVVGEVRSWNGHSPEALRAMREGLQRLKERGEDVIDD